MKEKSRLWCLPPCPPYDVEGTESWLGDMASRGWMLEKDGLLFGIASFERKEPSFVCYRLEPAPKQASNWDDNGGDPDTEVEELNAEYGWEYVARRGQLYIYRNTVEETRELHTDPQVQAFSIKALQKRQIGHLMLLICCWSVHLLLRFWKGTPFVTTAVEVGLPLTLLSIAVPGLVVLNSVVEIIHLQKLKQKLQAGIPLDHRKRWKNGTTIYFGKRLLVFLVIVLWFVLVLRLWNDDITDARKRALSDYSGKPPFATIVDFAEGTYKETWHDLRFDYVIQWSNAFLNTGIRWGEHADVERPDGSVLQGGYYADYYDAKSEWLAKTIAAEYHRYDRSQAKRNYEPLDCPEFGLDSAIAYRNQLHFPCIVFRQGTVVIHAYFYQTGKSEPIPWEEWAAILAASIR